MQYLKMFESLAKIGLIKKKRAIAHNPLKKTMEILQLLYNIVLFPNLYESCDSSVNMLHLMAG